jgi:co-chaperonin GroES (HSP10)
MIKPVGFCLLVKPDPVEKDMKAGSIVIPQDVLDKQRVEITTGTVLSIGTCAWHGLGDSSAWCSIGDRIVYAKYGGKAIVDEETQDKLMLILDKDVLAVI